MDFPSCDIFESEGETEKVDQQTLMMKERAGYKVRSCPPCVEPAALGRLSSLLSLISSPVLSLLREYFSLAGEHQLEVCRRSRLQPKGLQ